MMDLETCSHDVDVTWEVAVDDPAQHVWTCQTCGRSTGRFTVDWDEEGEWMEPDWR